MLNVYTIVQKTFIDSAELFVFVYTGDQTSFLCFYCVYICVQIINSVARKRAVSRNILTLR